ncbi:Acetamidase [Fusarium oxysporum f. sp. cubense]|uniref:amidase n=1 Tax=Fusarium oxysporum f. sp. cubense TaxID=61366 RepID=A0A559KWZ7_FUSOC|nr:Acetamidase [Fusarium oxysporum f. sp. cubense]
MPALTWQQKASAKQAEAKARIPAEWHLPAELLQQTSRDKLSVLDIPKTCGLLTDRELFITESFGATALRDKLAAGEFSAVEVATAFCKRSAIAQQLTCCLTETMFPMALARAQQLDEYLALHGKPVGPLHGVPISLKETFNVKGVPSSLGLVSFLEHELATKNSVLADILLAAGAVFYAKTNVPQTMMTADSHNNVFGRVLNPIHLNLTAGGSSGGEGALVAMRGSILGIGTDIAGSIRIPALCCGIFGFKPSVGRVPYAKQASAGRPGMTGIAPVAGPLCHSARDAELLLKVVFDAHADDMDDNALGLAWSDPAPRSSDTLTVGLFPEDPKTPLHPSMQRVLEEAVGKLKAAGHRIVDLSCKLPSLTDAADISFKFFRIDPDKTVLGHVSKSGEPFIPSLRFTYDLTGNEPEPTLRGLFDLNAARAEITGQMRKVFVDNKLDVILAPGYQSCAVPHDTFGVPVYTVIGNMIDYPACVIPFGHANEVADAKFVRDVTYVPNYLPKEVEGAPCHVQLIGRRLKDEELMKHAKVVEQVLSK